MTDLSQGAVSEHQVEMIRELLLLNPIKAIDDETECSSTADGLPFIGFGARVEAHVGLYRVWDLPPWLTSSTRPI